MINRKGIVAIASTMILVAVVVLLSFRYANLNNPFTIRVDDTVLTQNWDSDLVSGVLNAAGVSIGPYDLIDPSLETKVSPGAIITIERAKEVRVNTNGVDSRHWTNQNKLSEFLAEINANFGPTTRISVNGKQIPRNSLDIQTIPQEVSLNDQKTIHIIDGAERQTVTTLEDTVGLVLWENDISIVASDNITPSIGSWLSDEQDITIRRANRYRIEDGGREYWVTSHYTKVQDVLHDANISMVVSDYSTPALSAEVQSGETIVLTRIKYEYVILDEAIPFGTSLVPSPDIELDQRALLSNGSPGLSRKVIRIVYENDVATTETLVGEWVVQPPIDQTIGYGIRIVVRILDTTDGPIEYWRVVSMRATSYTAASSGKPRSHPTYGITASGVPAGTGVVAIDPDIVPFRSNLYIPGYGRAFAGDTGGLVKGRIIDLGYNEGELQSWRGFVDVYYLTPVPPAEQINYLLPQ